MDDTNNIDVLHTPDLTSPNMTSYLFHGGCVSHIHTIGISSGRVVLSVTFIPDYGMFNDIRFTDDGRLFPSLYFTNISTHYNIFVTYY